MSISPLLDTIRHGAIGVRLGVAVGVAFGVAVGVALGWVVHCVEVRNGSERSMQWKGGPCGDWYGLQYGDRKNDPPVPVHWRIGQRRRIGDLWAFYPIVIDDCDRPPSGVRFLVWRQGQAVPGTFESLREAVEFCDRHHSTVRFWWARFWRRLL